MPHPAYKDHPIWREAMALVEAAYALSDHAKASSPTVARHLRKVAVTIPASLADALADEPEREVAEDRRRALGALAEIERQTLFLQPELAAEGDALARRARGLYREVERLLAEVKEFS
jgi:four helix bundle protein